MHAPRLSEAGCSWLLVDLCSGERENIAQIYAIITSPYARCLRRPILLLSVRQPRKYFCKEATPVQLLSSTQASTSTAGVSEGMNGSNMNSTADRLIWVDLEVNTGLFML